MSRIDAVAARRALGVGVVLAGGALGGCAPAAPAGRPLGTVAAQAAAPGPRYADPERRKKLEATFSRVDEVVEAYRKDDNIPGMVVAIVVDGEIAHWKGYGLADVASGRVPDLDTRFRLASVSKSFTALAALRLRDEGKLSLDDSLSRFLPGAARIVGPADQPPVTLRELLSHTAGVPRDGGGPDHADDATAATAVEKALRDYAVGRGPAGTWAYSNFGYNLLAEAASKAVGMPFRDVVKQRLLSPLGMTSTTFDLREVPAGTLATPYARKNGKVVPITTPLPGFGEGASGMITTARDLGRFAAMLLDAYPARAGVESQPVRRATLREAMTPHASGRGLQIWLRDVPTPQRRPVGAVDMTYGFGFFLKQTCNYPRVVGHNGTMDGYASHLALMPTHGVAVVVLSNLRDADAEGVGDDVFFTLERGGGLVPRRQPEEVFRPFRPAVDDLLAVVNAWSDAGYASMLSRGRPRLPEERTELERYRALHGRCTSITPLTLHGPAEGTFAFSCTRGVLDMRVTLGADGRIFGFGGTSRGLAAPAELHAAAEQVVALTRAWADAVFERAFAKHHEDRAALERQLHRVRVAKGKCTLGRHQVTPSGSSFSVTCEHGDPLTLTVQLDPNDKERIKTFQLVPEDSSACPAY